MSDDVSGFWRRRISRRKAIGGTAAVGLGAAAAGIVGCGGGDSGGEQILGLLSPRVDTTRSARAGGVFQSYTTRDVSGFDYIGATTNIDRGEAQFAYSRLFKWKPGVVNPPDRGEIQGDLAESWEIDLNNLRITIKLRPEARWDQRTPTNGRQLDSQDVKFTFDRMKAVSPYRRDWFSDLSPAAPFAGMDTPDPRTVVLRLAYPLGAVFDFLANTLGLFVMPRESDGRFDPRQDLRGTGPWMLDEYQPSVGFEYKKNPNWYIKDRPFLDGWSRPIVSEYSQLLAQFRAGNIWDGGFIRQEDIIQTKRDLPHTLLHQGEYGPTAPGVFFGWLSPFKDVRLRRALSLLIDRELFAITNSNQDRFAAEGIDIGIVYDNFLGRGWGDYWLDPYSKEMGDLSKWYKLDIAEAKRLISAAGFPNGLDTNFFFPTGAPYGVAYNSNNQILAGFFREGGIRLNFREVGYSNDYVPNYNYNQAFDGLSVFVNTTYGGVANNIRTNWHSESAQDRSPWAPTKIDKSAGGPRDTKLDGMIDSLLRETDYQKAVRTTHDIQKHLTDVLYTVPFGYKAKGLGLTQPWVGNAGVYRGWVISSAPTDTMPFLWYDASKRS